MTRWAKRSARPAKRLTAAVASIAALLISSPAVTDRAEAVASTGAQPISETWLAAATADEGLTVAGGNGRVLTRGHGSIPPSLRTLGWTHIGDPDAAPGFVVDAYQGPVGSTSKAFAVNYADGRRVLLVHPLAAGESYHNSFVTVSPYGHWLVAGEWGTVNRLLVFALPTPSRTGLVQTLPLAGVIALTHPVRNVQGCDFNSARQLLCSTNDMTTGLFPVTRQFLALRLSHVLNGKAVTAKVRLAGSVPSQDVCAGPSGEVEGIDVTDGTVRVAVNSPCSSVTEIFTYPRRARWRGGVDVDLRTSWSGPPPFVGVAVPLPSFRQRRADD